MKKQEENTEEKIEKKSKEKMKKPSKADIEIYKKYVKGGMGEYLLTQGGKMGILFAGIMFIIHYFLDDVGSAGEYLFLGIFFGLAMGLIGWHNINKKIKEYEDKKWNTTDTKR